MMRKTTLGLGLLCALILLSPTLAIAQDDEPYDEPWRIEGGWYAPASYVGEHREAVLVTVTRTAGNRYLLEMRAASPPPLWFLGEEKRTVHAGPVEYEGEGVWGFTVVSYPQAGDGSVVATVGVSGRMTLGDDGLLHMVSDWCVYSPDQDPFGDELPLYGCYPDYIWNFLRIPREDVP